MRYIDLLIALGIFPKRACEDFIVFDATQIAVSLEKTKHQNKFPAAESYGVCSPPYIGRPFWIEAVVPFSPPRPSGLLSAIYPKELMDIVVQQQMGKLMYQGMLCHAYDIKKDDADVSALMKLSGGTLTGETRWVMTMRGYTTSYPSNTKFLRTAETAITGEEIAILHFGEDGYLLDDTRSVQTVLDKEMIAKTGGNQYIVGVGTASMVPLALLSLSFLHRRTEVEHIKPSKHARKKFRRAIGQKRGAVDLVDYYLVKVKPHPEGSHEFDSLAEIEPLRQKGRSPRSHRVRGHFRRVGLSGLFGRGDHAGELIWIPDHARGDTSLGTTKKGYQLEG